MGYTIYNISTYPNRLKSKLTKFIIQYNKIIKITQFNWFLTKKENSNAKKHI